MVSSLCSFRFKVNDALSVPANAKVSDVPSVLEVQKVNDVLLARIRPSYLISIP